MSTALSEKSVCARIADRLVQSIGPRRYSMWFDRSVRINYYGQQHRLEVAVPNQFVADWVDRNFRDELHDAARDELDGTVGLQVRVNADLFTKSQIAVVGAAFRPVSVTEPRRVCTHGDTHRRADAAPRYQFDDFVVGACNELAFSAANRVIEDEHRAINPLFVHGGCGLGKTHLLQGLCCKMMRQRPGDRVLYTTGEQFTNEFLAAMRANKIDRFRNKIRRLDLLAVDDIHFLANKQATQQEFLHSFDAIELGGARVILASDSHPTLIRQFTEALVSRCVRGMVVQVHRPDADTRRKIIRALAHRRGLLLLEPAVEALASGCAGSIREIEGALTKLHALASLAAKRQTTSMGPNKDSHRGLLSVGNALIQQLFHSEATSYPTKAVRFDTILSTVVGHLNVDRAQVLSAGRHHRVVLARSVVIFLARQMTMMSYPEIAAAMNRRTHSTIITAVQRVKKQLEGDVVVNVSPSMEQVSLVDLIERLRRAIVRA